MAGDKMADWFDFDAILRMYMLRKLRSVGSQQELSELCGLSPNSRQHMSGIFRAKRHVLSQHLEAIHNNEGTKRSDILRDLLEIAEEMERGAITEDIFGERLNEAHKRGRPKLQANKDEWSPDGD